MNITSSVCYLRAERGLLMEVAMHEFTVLPRGDLTSARIQQAGVTSHTVTRTWKEQNQKCV